MGVMVCCVVCWAATAETPWHHPLSCDGGGYWPLRVPVCVRNIGDGPLSGMPAPIELTQANGLVGNAVAGLRVVDADGDEVLYDVRDDKGEPKRGAVSLADGDRIVLPVEIPAKGNATYYLYAGNPAAWPVMDWLSTGMANGGFEQGGDMPEKWTSSLADDAHRLSLTRDGARSGKVCARCDVDSGAAPVWVNYSQRGMFVTPGHKYRFTAWVKAKDVLGQAGWYVHVDGSQPLIINEVAAWNGSFDWRQSVIEFVVPETGQTFECGTVLHGTGTAWYDDVRLENVDGNGMVQSEFLPVETLRLETAPPDISWPSETGWEWRAQVRLRNFTGQQVDKQLAACDIRSFRNALAKIIGFTTPPAMMLIDPDAPGQPLPIHEPTTGDLGLVASIPPKTEKSLWLYAARKMPGAEAENTMSEAQLVNGPMNSLANGDMEQGGDGAPMSWVSGKEDRPDDHSFEARRVEGGVSGSWCLELQVPKGPGEPGWVGWRQKVPVKPRTRYVLSGFIKTQDLDGDATVYGHVLRPDGSTIDALNFGAAPFVAGSKDWTRVEAAIVTPRDCGFIEIHLTTNRHGTIWHDAVMLAEAQTGITGAVEARIKPAGPMAWPVSPLVKVFQDDLPPDTSLSESIKVCAARNSSEPFQVAVRVPEDETIVLTATSLRGPEGATLEPPTIYRVGFVPIDFPIGYHSTTAPAHKRLLPVSRGNDGWTGWWPDPLEPVRVENGDRETHASVALKADKTQPFWFDLDVPANATPGAYTGAIAIGHTTIPVTLTVWDFAMPEEKHLPALYDLRSGPLGDFLSGPDRKAILRQWHQFLAKFNVSPSMTANDPVFTYENGHVAMQAREFDEEAHDLLDVLHVNKLYAPQIFYACGWAFLPKDMFGLKAFTPEYVAAWKEAYKLFVDHITEKGWRNRFVFYLADEPFEKSEPTITGLARLSDMAREIAPDVPVYSSTWTDIRGLEGHLTQWGIGVHGSFPLERVEARRAAGERFWFTTDGHMCTDTPLLAIERLLPWFCFRYGVDGYEFWGVSWWSVDPWQYGWHQYISQSDEGKKYYHVRYPNGDGFLAYPPRGPHEAPVPSIRLMAARAGVDDFEIFLALRSYADAGDPDARAALEKVRSLTPGIPNEGGRFSTMLMHDPYAIQEARNAAGDTLSALIRRDNTRR
jgi:hypothetical protein